VWVLPVRLPGAGGFLLVRDHQSNHRPSKSFTNEAQLWRQTTDLSGVISINTNDMPLQLAQIKHNIGTVHRSNYPSNRARGPARFNLHVQEVEFLNSDQMCCILKMTGRVNFGGVQTAAIYSRWGQKEGQLTNNPLVHATTLAHATTLISSVIRHFHILKDFHVL
jgi:hypothetical protein